MIRALALLCALAIPAGAQTTPMPFDVGGHYRLLDQTGAERTEADPDGRVQLLFFGYANCQEICSAALPLMAEVTEAVADVGHEVTPVMITVAPEIDTPEHMNRRMAELHPDFIGLTGDDRALQAAWDAFAIEREALFVDPEFGPVYAHGSFVYLLDGDGAVLTLIPPVLTPQQVAEIVLTYLDGSA